ncbi:MAG: CDGSH iron-sulfur domain-containing protein [Anaerolineae bacterium]
MINTQKVPQRHEEEVPVGKRVAFCRCWQSGKFPYCDGTHRKINADTGDAVGPVIVTAVAAAEEKSE